MMKPTFREDKATQAAALLIGLRGGKMSKIKLMKLLYIAEREALLKWRRPIIYDLYASMPNGPVPSTVLNLANGEIDSKGIWAEFISAPENHEVRVLNDPGSDSLSDAEEELLRDVFHRFGKMNRWDLCNMTHDFPEYVDPEGSSIPIEYKDILRSGGFTDVEIASVLQEIKNVAIMDMYLS